jgi:hypothetical protein
MEMFSKVLQQQHPRHQNEARVKRKRKENQEKLVAPFKNRFISY